MEFVRFPYMRYQDWSGRWVEFIKDSMDLAPELVLDWDSEGITCFSWAAAGCEAITGHNPHDPWVGQYNGIIDLLRLMKKYGYSTLDDYVAKLFPEVPVGMAQQGDWVLVRAPEWSNGEELAAEEAIPHAVALVEPPFYYAVTTKGLAKGDLYKDGVRAFAVGRRV